MKKYFKTTIVIVIFITLVVAFTVQGVLKKKLKGGPKATPVRIEVIEPSKLVEFVTAPGEVEPKIKVDLSAKVSGRLLELPFEEGQLVTKGDPDANPPIPPSVLIKLDSKDVESRLRSAEAGYRGQEAQIAVDKAQIARTKANHEGTAASLKQAQRDIVRQKKLLDSQDIPQAIFDEKQSTLDNLVATFESELHALSALELGLTVSQYRLDASKEAIEQAKEAISYTTITSPLDGIVTRINAEVGEVVMTGTMNNPGTVIMQVADLSQMLLVAQVDETDIGNLKVGQKVNIRVQAFWEDEFTGVVDTIALTHDMSRMGTKYYKTEILLDESEMTLNSGLTADVDIETITHENVIKVPSQAVLGRKVDDIPLKIRDNNPNIDKNKNDCMVVYRYIDNKAVVTPVTIGPSDLTHILIKSGLNKDDPIIIGPYKVLELLKHDQKVKDEKEIQAEDIAKKKEKEKLTGKDKGDDSNSNKEDN